MMPPAIGTNGSAPAATSSQAKSLEEIAPLLAMCRAGRFFDVQAWIAAGRPVDLPPKGKGTQPFSPLIIAIRSGFHSLAEVLLRSGADPRGAGLSGPINQSIKLQRLDLVQLLVAHGADPLAADMQLVWETWKQELIEFFLDRGAEAGGGRSLALALCNRNRIALTVCKRYLERVPSFQEQANIALRYHCKGENLQWVAMLLRAGADPYAEGPDEPRDMRDRRGDSALEIAALNGHEKVFRMRQVKLDPERPELIDVAKSAISGAENGILKKIIQSGLRLNDQQEGSCSLYEALFWKLSMDADRYPAKWHDTANQWYGGDSGTTKRLLQSADILARNGAKWCPAPNEIDDLRKTLLKLKPLMTMRLVAVLVEHKVCSASCIRRLLDSKKMKKHIAMYARRLVKAVSTLPE
jgi:hypothetical protein